MKTIVIISGDIVLKNIITRVLKPLYNVAAFKDITSVLDYIYNSIPEVIIIEIDTGNTTAIDILNGLKGDPIFYRLPVIAVLPDSLALPEWGSFFVDDYVRLSNLEKEILPRVDLCIVRSERVVEINPLTRLPGNISINKQIQTRIDGGATFALAYLDIDQFKPFNDKYGFSRGDDVLKATGRLILNIVTNKQPQNSFVGHIGGDDFIYIMDVNLIEETSGEIINAFDKIISTFYDAEDRERGYIQSTDRQGKTKIFSMMAVSIGITHNKNIQFAHYGEITETASRMKSFAKHTKSSCFRIDKRYGPITA